MKPLIKVQDVDITYGNKQVLRGVNLEIGAGEIVTLIGPNGSGKSSLARAILGALPIAAGAISHSPDLQIGYVPQNLAVDRAMPISAARFMALPGKVDKKVILSAARRLGVDHVLDQQIGSLSGGLLQRMLLARAIMGAPGLLILDEPVQGMDQPATADFYQLLEEVRNETGCGILLVSHDLHVVMSASDRVICLNGHVCCEGTPQVVQDAPEYRALFGPGTKGTMALYRHEHDHDHDHDHVHDHADVAAPHEKGPVQ